MKGTLILIYTPHIPYNNRQRYKDAIEKFGSECDFELIEVPSESERGQRLIADPTYGGASPQLLGFFPPHSNWIALNPNGGGWLFQTEREFKYFFDAYRDLGKRLESGMSEAEATDKGKEDLKKKADADSPFKGLADALKMPIENVKKGVQMLGITVVAGAIGFGYLYYKAHQTNVNINFEK